MRTLVSRAAKQLDLAQQLSGVSRRRTLVSKTAVFFSPQANKRGNVDRGKLFQGLWAISSLRWACVGPKLSCEQIAKASPEHGEMSGSFSRIHL